MFQRQLLLILLAMHCFHQIISGSHFNRLPLSSASLFDPGSASLYNDGDSHNTEDVSLPWQTRLHKNWIIFQQTNPDEQKRLRAFGSKTINTRALRVKHHQQKQKHDQRQQLLAKQHARQSSIAAEAIDASPMQRHPINYYAYSRNNRSDAAINESLQQNNVQVQSDTNPYMFSLNRFHQDIKPVNTSIWRKLVVPNVELPLNNNNHSSNLVKDEAAPATVLENSPAEIDVIDEGNVDDAQLESVLRPVQTALDRVKQFCEVAQGFLSDEDEDETDNEIEILDNTNEMNTTMPTKSKWTAKSMTSIDNNISSTGRKIKKIKKKFKKLLLPLLIAYKLKFLTLVPVIIGGLTLLVGTTGLAGFFFALFTAVMTMKSNGGKSVVVKDI